MQASVLITLGRLPKALDLARSFSQLGYRVIVAEPFRWHVTGVSNHVAKTYQVTAPLVNREQYLQQLLEIVVKENISFVVPVSEEIIHVSFLRARLTALIDQGRAVTLYAMPSATLLRLHNKFQFIDCCREYGLAAPETAMLVNNANSADSTVGIEARRASHADRLNDTFDTVIKPVFSCSGRGVIFHSRGQQLPLAEADTPLIVQQKIGGELLSTFSIAHEGRVITTVVYRGIVMSGTVAVAFERIADDEAGHQIVSAWVSKFIGTSKFSGFISFDLIVDELGVAYGIECNPRATSGLHFVDTRDLARAIVSPIGGTPIRFRKARRLQQFYPCLTEVQKSMFGKNFFANLTALWHAKDVTWSWRDPLPFITMPITASQIIYLAMKSGCTFGEVATLDVGWYQDLPANEHSQQ